MSYYKSLFMLNRRSTFILSLSVLLASCVSTSPIVPMGKDSYMITGSGNGYPSSRGQSKALAAQQANEYCANMKKLIVVRRMDSDMFGTVTTLVFSCVNEDDPEYVRPNLRRDPTTIIEDQRK